MTRRGFLSVLPVAFVRAPAVVVVPVHIVQDADAKITPRQFQYFWWSVWPEAVREFGRCGIRLDAKLTAGSVWRPPSREPVVLGLEHGVLNLVITDRIPLEWDNGRSL